MATAKETANLLQRAAEAKAPEKKGPKNMKGWIQAMEPQIAKALPSVITPERFTRIAMTAVSTNPQLAASTPQSFIGAMMQAAQLGLEPNTPLGQAYLIPYRIHGRLETQFQIGFKGMIDLAHRSGEFQTIYAETVYENDEFSYQYGLEPKLEHKPAMENRGKPIYYYAVYKLTNGGFGFEVMSKADVEAHARKFSKAYSRGPWQTNFDEMAKKTVLKKALKYAPIRTDFAKGAAADETITLAKEDEDLGMVFDQEPIEADYTVQEEQEEVEETNGEVQQG